ncbi:MAG: hypothetical protein Q7N50_14825, partial [Armatimonadota bacterium]|nr:hypothetical protein [Armatimonadota bacterium]
MPPFMPPLPPLNTAIISPYRHARIEIGSGQARWGISENPATDVLRERDTLSFGFCVELIALGFGDAEPQ